MTETAAPRVLVVEDSAMMRRLVGATLRVLGNCDVSQARDGTSALEEMRRRPPDLIISDLSMRPMNGIAFTKRVRAGTANPDVPIIMITGHTDRETIATARAAGVTEVMVKPLTPETLLDRVVDVMAARVD
jgi:CheY-like chemotaxis protein